MTKRRKSSKVKVGLPPGSLVYTGDPREEKIKIDIIDYTEATIEEKSIDSVEGCINFKEKDSVTWINVTGVHDTSLVADLGQAYDIHPLVLEDIVHTNQRPKLEIFDDYLYFVLKMIRLAEDGSLLIEQISLILGKNYVISFQETEGDVFDSVRDRIRTSKGKVRKMKSDFLAYALIDAIVDNYFVILESIGDDVEDLEEELIQSSSRETLNKLRTLKRKLIFLRKSVWPLREVISKLERGESTLIKKSTEIYLRDMYDHTIQVIDTTETLRDITAGMMDLYLSSVSNKMNEVMKVLTIIATIFIPLTFIAGVYGMNFKYMPELSVPWAYGAVWGVMIIIGLSMIIYFRKKGWL